MKKAGAQSRGSRQGFWATAPPRQGPQNRGSGQVQRAGLEGGPVGSQQRRPPQQQQQGGSCTHWQGRRQVRRGARGGSRPSQPQQRAQVPRQQLTEPSRPAQPSLWKAASSACFWKGVFSCAFLGLLALSGEDTTPAAAAEAEGAWEAAAEVGAARGGTPTAGAEGGCPSPGEPPPAAAAAASGAAGAGADACGSASGCTATVTAPAAAAGGCARPGGGGAVPTRPLAASWTAAGGGRGAAAAAVMVSSAAACGCEPPGACCLGGPSASSVPAGWPPGTKMPGSASIGAAPATEQHGRHAQHPLGSEVPGLLPGASGLCRQLWQPSGSSSGLVHVQHACGAFSV